MITNYENPMQVKFLGFDATLEYGEPYWTGGIAYSDVVTSDLKEATGWIAPITVYPGEDELLALVQGGLRVLNGEEKALEY